jgi:rhomboid family GlyGly-CTERM serine protease
MIRFRSPHILPDTLIVFFALAMVALAMAPEKDNQALALVPGMALQSEYWRLWTGHIVHYGVVHAAVNALVFSVLAVMTRHLISTKLLVLLLLTAAPLISCGVPLLSPQLIEYRGLSAIVTMLTVLVGLLLFLRATDMRHRVVLLLLLLSVAMKIVLEAHGVAVFGVGLSADIAVEWRAHAVGALIGAVIGLVAGIGLWAASVQQAAFDDDETHAIKFAENSVRL